MEISGNEKVYVRIEDLGRMSYREAWDYQELLLQANLAIKTERRKREMHTLSDSDTNLADLKTSNHLLFVEHPPVYTLGKSGDMNHVLISESERQKRDIEFAETNRGGDITFHGLGQIVGYPILDLEYFGTDIGKYLRRLEEVIIRVLSDYGLSGARSVGETGVWLDPDIKGRERKICAMGVRCSRWITMHGFALNVNTDLSFFQHIIPCGIPDKKVTSLQQELGRALELDEVKEKIQLHFAEVFGVRFIDI